MRLLLTLFAVLTLNGQSFYSSIGGTVTNATGEAVAGAIVHIVRVDANGNYHVKTSKKGRFTFGGLPFGRYQVSVESKADGSSAPITVDTTVSANVKVALQLPGSDGTARPQKSSVTPTQDPIIEGCITTGDIYSVKGGPYLFQGTVLQSNVPRLQATITNECDYVANVSLTLAYYDGAGTQFDTKFASATIAPGTRYSLIHLLECATLPGSCTPEQWKTRIRIIQVRAFRN